MIWNGKIQNQRGFPLLLFRKALVLLTFLVFSVVAPGEWSISNASEDDVVAEGNGFKLTEGDVEKVRAFYDKTPIRAPEAEFHLAAFKIKIFAYEAVARQLDKGMGIRPEDADTVESWLKLADACYKDVLEKYPITDVVIDSYYRAFPERFKDEVNSGGLDQKALDAETRKRIRDVIVIAKNDKILSQTIDYLKNKYGIKFVGKHAVLNLS